MTEYWTHTTFTWFERHSSMVASLFESNWTHGKLRQKTESSLSLFAASPSLSLHIRLRPNQIRIVQVLPNQLVQVSSDVRSFNASHVVLHVNAFRPVCVGDFQGPSCSPKYAFQGTDVGWEVILKSPSRRDQFNPYILSKTKQSVFLSLRAYKKGEKSLAIILLAFKHFARKWNFRDLEASLRECDFHFDKNECFVTSTRMHHDENERDYDMAMHACSRV